MFARAARQNSCIRDGETQFAEQIVDFAVLAIKEGLVEVIQALRQDCIQGWFAEQNVDFAAPPIKEELVEASPSGAHRGADKNTPRATDQDEHRGGAAALATGAHPRGTLGPQTTAHIAEVVQPWPHQVKSAFTSMRSRQ